MVNIGLRLRQKLAMDEAERLIKNAESAKKYTKRIWYIDVGPLPPTLSIEQNLDLENAKNQIRVTTNKIGTNGE